MRCFGFGVHAAQQDFVLLAERDQFVPGGRALQAHARRRAITWLSTPMPNCAEQCFGQRADGHARRGLARAGAFQNVAGVVEIVLDGAGQVGVAGTRARDRLVLVLGAVDILHRQRFGPVLPVLVADDDGDGRADGLGVAHAGDNFGAVGFDLHAPAAAVALLAAPQLAIDGVERDRDAGGQPRQGRHQALAMRFSGCFKAEHLLGETLS